MTIPLFKTKFHSEAYGNVKRVMDSGWPGLGKETTLFEQELADYLGCRFVLCTNSGTEALRMALEASPIKKGGAILTTPNTFVSTNSVIVQAGFEPVFADIDYKTGSLDFNSAFRMINTRKGLKFVGIMVVHYGGMPVDLNEFRQLAKDHKCILIEDSAHAFGASYDGIKIGSDTSYGCFSFHAVKPLALGEGGAFITDDAQLYETVKKLRWLGIDKSTYERSTGTKYSWDYDVTTLGFKSHISDVAAAIGRGQLLHYEEDRAKRAELVDRYTSNLLFLNEVEIVGKQAGKVSANHLFVIKLPDYTVRAKVIKGLEKAEIQWGHHYKNNARFNAFKRCIGADLKNMERWNETALSLPLHLYMQPVDVDYICSVIESSLKGG